MSIDQLDRSLSALEPLRWWDIPEVVALEQRLFQGDSPWSAEMFWSELAAGHHYVVKRGADVIDGYAGIALADDAQVNTIGVRPECQGTGVGRVLLDDLLIAAAHRRVLLEVRTDNLPAISLYQRAGFSRIGLRHKYYQPSGADAYVMERPAATEAGERR